MILRGKKVILRAIERKDMALLLDLINDPEIEHMTIGTNPPVSMEQQEIWYEKNMNIKDPMRWIIETECDGAVGLVIMGNFDWKNRVAHETGIKVKEEKITESGVALDALLTMFDYGFNELNLNRIEGCYLDYNKSSAALAKLAGRTIEGRLREAVYKNGEYHDLILVANLKADFQRRKETK